MIIEIKSQFSQLSLSLFLPLPHSFHSLPPLSHLLILISIYNSFPNSLGIHKAHSSAHHLLILPPQRKPSLELKQQGSGSISYLSSPPSHIIKCHSQLLRGKELFFQIYRVFPRIAFELIRGQVHYIASLT